MIATNLKETEETIAEKLSSSEDTDVMVFFGSNNFYIHSPEEMAAKFTEDELAMTIKIADIIEQFDISHKPYMPKFELPQFPRLPYMANCPTDYDKYLMFLCVEGAKKLHPWTNKAWLKKNQKISKEDYWKRLNDELSVIYEADLGQYFLVVWDYCMAADYRPADHSFDWKTNLLNNGMLDPIPRALGRGSAAGCLISYLTGITGIDPLLYDLLFSRFYNKGRNTGDHIELPDIDTDVSVENREWVIDYLSNKYGKENVSQIITFQRMQGRAALKDVIRVKGIANGFELSNEICKFIPSESEIADDIQDMREHGEENYGIIRWAIDNSNDIQEYYSDKTLKALFDQAMRCEGVKRGQGRHPSGVVITPKPVNECFPMAYDTKSKQQIIGIDMQDMAKLGGVKMDVLGTAILDKLKMAQDLVNGTGHKRDKYDYYDAE